LEPWSGSYMYNFANCEVTSLCSFSLLLSHSNTRERTCSAWNWKAGFCLLMALGRFLILYSIYEGPMSSTKKKSVQVQVRPHQATPRQPESHRANLASTPTQSAWAVLLRASSSVCADHPLSRLHVPAPVQHREHPAGVGRAWKWHPDAGDGADTEGEDPLDLNSRRMR
jgi:hypothetical protein